LLSGSVLRFVERWAYDDWAWAVLFGEGEWVCLMLSPFVVCCYGLFVGALRVCWVFLGLFLRWPQGLTVSFAMLMMLMLRLVRDDDDVYVVVVVAVAVVAP